MRISIALMLAMLAGTSQAALAAEITPIPAASPQASSAHLVISNGKNTFKLSITDIERLPMYQTTMKTKWGLNGVYQGVMMKDLMAKYHFGKSTRRIVFHALDNYTAGLSIGEFERSPAMLATRFNGHPISLENKGPLILMWPAKEQEALQGEATLSSWIWSISEISAQ